MPDFDEDAGPMMVLPTAPQRKGRPVLAWTVIVLAVLFVVLLRSQAGWVRELTRALHPAERELAAEDRTGELIVQLQARFLVGAGCLFPDLKRELYAQAQALNTGPVEQRLRFVVLAGELASPKEAVEQLNDLEDRLAKNDLVPTPIDELLMDTLNRLYRDYSQGRLDAPSVSTEEGARLRRKLGWFGQLALSPADGPDVAAQAEVMRPAYRTLWAICGLVTLLGVLGLTGFAALVLFLVCLLRGKLQQGVHTGSHHGAVYAETFALWMLLFLGFSFAVNRFAPAESSLLNNGIVILISLTALVWPVLRGVPWRQVRWEIGLQPGKRAALEPAIGIAGYAMALPLFALGCLITAMLIRIQAGFQGTGGSPDDFSPPQLPGHPVFPYVSGGSAWDKMQVLLLAALIAPLAEETMFRGVLYRHLREASARLGTGWSIFSSATLTSFVFAVIHPQGLVTVPALMSLAYALTLLREWRGTLIPGIVAHGLHNGVLLLFSMIALSG